MNKKPNPELLDDENPEWSDAMIQESVRLSGLPASLRAKLRGRPKLETPKEAVKIRLDSDVLAALRSSGDGWQTRINDTLRASLALSGKLKTG